MSPLTGIEEPEQPVRSEIPLRLAPNPTQGSTLVSYQLTRPEQVSCVVYDATGRTVDVLFDGVQDAGAHSLSWDASRLSPGVYLCQVVSATGSSFSRLVKTR